MKDPKQGLLGDCALVSSICVVASLPSFPYIWSRVYCEEKSDAANGKHCFRIYELGKRKDVIIDDYIPCYSNKKPIFARSADPNEMWVCLLEKAFAAFYGSYMALESGVTSEYMHRWNSNLPRYQIQEKGKGLETHFKSSLYHQIPLHRHRY